MTDRVLLGASVHTFDACLQLAHEYGVGLELQAFAYPEVLDNGWEILVERYKRALIDLPGERSMHGPFLDMSSGSPDPQIREVVARRINHSIEIADRLNVPLIVYHANFIASIRNGSYRRDWSAQQVEFWQPLAERAGRLGITLALENMWEFDPHIIADVLQQVDSPSLMACLDVGHALLFSEVALATWLEVMSPYVTHLHLNNNLGEIDEHRALNNGVINYPAILPSLRALPRHPSFCLEISDPEAIRRSMIYLDTPRKVQSLKRKTQV